MSSTETISVLMKRGGYMPLMVSGLVYHDSDGAGRRWVQVDIESIQWPGGGEVTEKNIADMAQVEEAFQAAVEGSSQAAYEDARERALDGH